MRQDLHSSGVGVSAVFPGFVRDAGMFADSGAKLPPGAGHRAPPRRSPTPSFARSSATAARSTSRPSPMRLGTAFAGFAPEVAATVIRATGGAKVGDRIGAEHRVEALTAPGDG